MAVRDSQKKKNVMDGSPGLVVMGVNSCHGFKFQHCILDGHFHIYLLKNCNVS